MKGLMIQGISKKEVDFDAINRNPLVVNPAALPFRCEFLEQLPHSDKRCEFCLFEFDTFSSLCAHQGKPCHLQEGADGGDGEQHQLEILINDPEARRLVADVLEEMQLPLDNNGAIRCGVRMAEIVRRRLYSSLVSSFNLEEYYELIKAHTSKSVWLELSEERVELLRRLCSLSLAASLGMGGRETQKETTAREQLEEELTKLANSCDSQPLFVKCSTRSPKDGVRLSADEKELPAGEKAALKLQKMMVSNGEEALQLLSRSQRIMADIGSLQRYGLPNCTSGKMAIILREFDENIDAQLEFRCYIHQGTMRSISQYNCYDVFNVLQPAGVAEKCAAAILKTWGSVKKDLAKKFNNYVVDFAVYKGFECATIVEVNPPISSGLGLFQWDVDYDLLLGGAEENCGVVFRYLTP